jgi:ABC-type multidrug transport system permease subunit
MRMIKTSTAGYISVIQFVLGACFGYSVIAGIIAGLVTSLILNYFGVDID